MNDKHGTWKSLGDVLDEMEQAHNAELAKRGLRRATREEVAELHAELDRKYGFVVPVTDFVQPKKKENT